MYLQTASLETIQEAINLLNPEKDEIILVLLAESGHPPLEALVESLQSKHIHFMGGIFPGLISGAELKREGVILKKFRCSVPPICVSGIAGSNLHGIEAIERIAAPISGTTLILVDGYTPDIYLFLEILNDLLGENCHFIGGGAGYQHLQQAPCIFSNHGLFQDAAVVTVIPQQSQLGVRHGWEQLDVPMVATQAKGNVLSSLNWQKAFDVYQDILRQECGVDIQAEQFQQISRGFPFGIMRDQKDDIVRDPLGIGENGEIICIGEIPPNAVLHVLKGKPEHLLAAARQAMSDCGAKPDQPIDVATTFVVDCFSRAEYLDNQFSEELEIIRNNLHVNCPEQEPFGMLSLGEISSYGSGVLELFNKTIVIGAINGVQE